jgi:endogenous inhibitor of DNA gyrase (YacG/DUF329 family)
MSPAPHQCPTCSKPVERGLDTFPFCSGRCRLVDLGKWFRGGYRISRPLTPGDDAPGEEEAGGAPGDEAGEEE